VLRSVSPLFLVLIAVAGLLTSGCEATKTQKRPPNVVLILIDDLGWQDLGVYGSQFYETPHIDRLASQGIRFTNAYSASPVCSPSRASLLTGKNPANLKFTGHITSIGKHRYPEKGKIIPPVDRMYVPTEEVMIPEALSNLGYVSASIGKWHVGDKEDYFPTKQGFDVNIAGYEHGSPPTYWGPYEKDQAWNPVIKNLDDRVAGEYLTDRLTDEAIKFIEKNKEKPFFLYLSHYGVHTPLEAPDSLVRKYEQKLLQVGGQKNAVYGAMVENMDWNVGRLLSSLEEMNLEEETILIFCSDNGGDASITNNAPLRAGKGFVYEGGIRIPLIVKWPGAVKAGTTTDLPVITDDLLPTIVEMVGGQMPEGLDGRSLVGPMARNEALDRTSLAWYYPHYSPQAKMPGYAIRSGRYKLVEHYDPQKVELYDLASDVSEGEDLSSQMPEKVKELQGKFTEWLQAFDPIVHTDNPSYAPDYRSKP
jgi:arylsulfatase A